MILPLHSMEIHKYTRNTQIHKMVDIGKTLVKTVSRNMAFFILALKFCLLLELINDHGKNMSRNICLKWTFLYHGGGGSVDRP